MFSSKDSFNIQESEQMTLPWIVRMGYGVGHVLNDLCSALWFTYLVIFYNLVIGLSSAEAGLVLLVGQIADAAATPIIGVLTDKGLLCCCISRNRIKKTWYIIGTVLVVCTLPFIYSQCLGCENSPRYVQVIYYSSFIVIFQFGWAAAQTIHLALASVLSPLSEERTFLLSLRNTFTVLCNIIVYVVIYLMLELTGSKTERLSPNDLLKFQLMVLVVLVIGISTSIFFTIVVKEHSEEALLDPSQSNSRTNLSRQTYCEIFSQIKTYLVAIIYMGTRIFVNVIQTLVPLYLHETLQLDASTIAIVPLVMYITGFATSLIAGRMNNTLGPKGTYIFGTILVITASCWVYLGSGKIFNDYFIHIIAGLFGGANSILLVTALSVTAQLVGSNVGNSTFVYGLMSFTDKLSCGIVIMVIQYYKPNEVTMYYRDALVLSCGISSILAAITILFLRIPSETRESNNQVEAPPATVPA